MPKDAGFVEKPAFRTWKGRNMRGRPISRILYLSENRRWPFLWLHRCRCSY